MSSCTACSCRPLGEKDRYFTQRFSHTYHLPAKLPVSGTIVGFVSSLPLRNFRSSTTKACNPPHAAFVDATAHNALSAYSFSQLV